MKIFSTTSLSDKLRKGLEKTTSILKKGWETLRGGGLDEDTILNIEELLLQADVGIEVTSAIIERIEKEGTPERALQLVKEFIVNLFPPDPLPLDFSLVKRPWVIMLVGVNGSGKTTTAARLAYRYKERGYRVILGAADTFRAAAMEQLEIWGKRIDVPVVADKSIKDPGAMAYKTLEITRKEGYDVAIIDTAGRLHNKTHLMNELARVRRIQSRIIPDAPHEVLLVVDASTGMNAVAQAKEFMSITAVTGLVLTKLDGTAKGGCILPAVRETRLPVRYVGVGEDPDDLIPFSPEDYAEELLGIKHGIKTEG